MLLGKLEQHIVHLSTDYEALYKGLCDLELALLSGEYSALEQRRKKFEMLQVLNKARSHFDTLEALYDLKGSQEPIREQVV